MAIPNKTETHVILTIKDNGIDERVTEIKSPGFGLTIVKMLAEQLKGTYTIENDNGTKSVLEFEL
jgi:two-component sensor histidine kinase